MRDRRDNLKRLIFVALALTLPITSICAAHAGTPMPKQLLDKYYQGVTFFKAGDLEHAIIEFRSVALSMPEDPLIHISLASALQQHGDIEDAIAEYKRAISLRPYDAFARESMGLLLQSQGQIAEAINQYNEAVRLRSDVPLLRLNLGIACRINGDLDQAITQLQQGVQA